MNHFVKKHPYAASVLAAVLCVVFVSFGSASAQILALDNNKAYLVMGAACIFSALVGILLIKLMGRSLAEFGFQKTAPASWGKVWHFLPLLLLEVLPLLFFRLQAAANPLILLLFVVGVGFNEEIYFRGLAYQFLCSKGVKLAVIWSSALFGVLHSANLLGGANPLYTALQIAFAFLVGLVLSAVVALTGSLWVPILWHATHDYISIQTGDTLDAKALLLLALQTVVLLVYCVGLWRKLRLKKEIPSSPEPVDF